jgi:hypothetical protein
MIIEYYKNQLLSSEMEYFANCISELELKFYASDILARIGIVEQADFEMAINKAAALCRLTNVPVSKHFKVIYKENNKLIIKDWKLSQLACRIILISSTLQL